ncbi:TPA: hypothetical protein ACT5B2_000101 [Burkholderia cenocepacia]
MTLINCESTSPQSTTIEYVAGVPGLGKTRAAIGYMKSHIVSNVSGTANVAPHRNEPVHSPYVFYVAPTRKLLKQTYNNLRRAVTGKEDSEGYEARLDMFKKCTNLIASDDNGSRGPSVVQHIGSQLRSGRIGARPAKMYVPGFVIFMTHKTFLELPEHETFPHTVVLFDESRKCVQEKRKIKLGDKRARELFADLFEMVPAKSAGVGKPISGFYRLEPRDVDAESLYEDFTRHAGDVAQALCAIHDTLTAQKGRRAVRYFSKKPEARQDYCLLPIEVPTRPFDGFARVIVLSANFKHSQMYHLLWREGTETKNCTKPFLDSWLRGGYRQAVDEIATRYNSVTLVPLTFDEQMPSKSHFARGILLPREQVETFGSRLDELNINSTALAETVTALRSPDVNQTVARVRDNKLAHEFGQHGAHYNPIQWMLDKTEFLASHWWKKHSRPENSKALVVTNAAYADGTRLEFNPDNLALLSQGRVEGSNEFKKWNVIAFLGSLNPDPIDTEFLEKYLTGYNATDDYVVATAIQALGRGNMRDHKTDEPMLALISGVGLAIKVHQLLDALPMIDSTVTKKIGAMVRWDFNNYRKGAAEQKSGGLNAKQREKVSQSKRFGDEGRKRLNAIKMQISRKNAALRTDPKNEKLVAEIAALEAERGAILGNSK